MDIHEPNIPEDINIETINKKIEAIRSTPSIKEKINLVSQANQMIKHGREQLSNIQLISID